MSIVKVPSELRKRAYSGDREALMEILTLFEEKVITKLKNERDDLRWVQGFSAAVDSILDILSNPSALSSKRQNRDPNDW